MRILRTAFLLLTLPLLPAAAPADAPAQEAPLRLPAPAAITPVQIAPPPSYGPQTLAFADGVSATFDVTYASLRGFRPLTLDLYQPRARGAPLPLVVFVHGGGWNGGDTRHAGAFEDFPRELAALAAKGYVVASVSYRLSGEARFPAALQDIKTAIRWLRGHAGDLGIDNTQVAVWGDAAGGQLAALAGVTCGVAPFEPPIDRSAGEPPSDCVQAVVDWYGTTDLQSQAADARPSPESQTAAAGGPGFAPPPDSDEGDFLGCEPARCSPVVARLASPLGFVSATSPAFLIQHGTADITVPPSQSQKLYDALRKAGAPAELVLYPDVAHNFMRDGFTDPSTNRAAMDKLGAFLAATFPPGPVAGRIARPDQRGPLY